MRPLPAAIPINIICPLKPVINRLLHHSVNILAIYIYILSVGGSVWYMIRNLRCTVTIDSVLANSKDTERFRIHCERHFSSRLPPSGGTWKYAKAPSKKKTWRDSLPIDMLLSAMSVLVVAQSSSEIPEGLTNNLVYSAAEWEILLLKQRIHAALVTVAHSCSCGQDLLVFAR